MRRHPKREASSPVGSLNFGLMPTSERPATCVYATVTAPTPEQEARMVFQDCVDKKMRTAPQSLSATVDLGKR